MVESVGEGLQFVELTRGVAGGVELISLGHKLIKGIPLTACF